MQVRSLQRKNVKGLSLGTISPNEDRELPAPPPPRATFDFRPTASSSSLDRSSMTSTEYPGPNIDRCSLTNISNVGHGNGGYVCKVLHNPTGMVMATKTLNIGDYLIQKNIARELATLEACESDYIVQFYGQYRYENRLVLCMEFLDCGSLDRIYKLIGPLPEEVLVQVNAAVADGLSYLKKLKVTHRDIKPSNILVDRRGHIKLCDFGVSGVLVNSMVQTFVGTSYYMSPERVQGGAYTDAGDVWSLGISLAELALGEFPMKLVDAEGYPLSMFALMQVIVNEPAPKLPSTFSPDFVQYVDQCLVKDPDERIKVKQLCDTVFYRRSQNLKSRQSFLAWAQKLPTV